MRAGAKHVLEWMRQTGAVVDPHWLRRAQLAREDALSRLSTMADARFQPHLVQGMFAILWGTATPALDAFATQANSQALRYVSELPEADAHDVDGLVAPWEDYTWAFPPFALAHLTITRARKERLRTLLCVPTDTCAAATTAAQAFPVRSTDPVLCPPDFTQTAPLDAPRFRCCGGDAHHDLRLGTDADAVHHSNTVRSCALAGRMAPPCPGKAGWQAC